MRYGTRRSRRRACVVPEGELVEGGGEVELVVEFCRVDVLRMVRQLCSGLYEGMHAQMRRRMTLLTLRRRVNLHPTSSAAPLRLLNSFLSLEAARQQLALVPRAIVTVSLTPDNPYAMPAAKLEEKVTEYVRLGNSGLKVSKVRTVSYTPP